MCCICNGICSHIGPHSYCSVHGGQQVFGVTPTWQPTGWICPRCGRVWNPAAMTCICEPRPSMVT
jgi:hypothetical protein